MLIPRDGEPCSHPGCLSHITHPCEGCGRVAGHYPMQWLSECGWWDFDNGTGPMSGVQLDGWYKLETLERLVAHIKQHGYKEPEKC